MCVCFDPCVAPFWSPILALLPFEHHLQTRLLCRFLVGGTLLTFFHMETKSCKHRTQEKFILFMFCVGVPLAHMCHSRDSSHGSPLHVPHADLRITCHTGLLFTTKISAEERTTTRKPRRSSDAPASICTSPRLQLSDTTVRRRCISSSQLLAQILRCATCQIRMSFEWCRKTSSSFGSFALYFARV